jgi:hypothetical protein
MPTINAPARRQPIKPVDGSVSTMGRKEQTIYAAAQDLRCRLRLARSIWLVAPARSRDSAASLQPHGTLDIGRNSRHSP